MQKTFKASQLRNLYDQTGYDLSKQRSLSGFGIQHDGAIPNLSWYFESLAFTTNNEQEVADLTALMLAFSGSDFGTAVDENEPPSDTSQDAHAAVGKQVTLVRGDDLTLLQTLQGLADAGELELIAKRGSRGWLYDPSRKGYQPDDGGALIESIALLSAQPATFTAVPMGTGFRLGIDRDGDGVLDGLDLEPTAARLALDWSLEGERLTLTWKAKPNGVYDVEHGEDLESWEKVRRVTSEKRGELQHVEIVSPESARTFYRIVQIE